MTRIRSLPLPGLELVRVRGRAQVPEVAARIAGEPAVRSAEPNYLWYADQLPDDPEFDDLWGLHNTGQTGGTADADVDWPEAWDVATDSSGIVVAVIDTGIWIEHPDLQGRTWTNPGETVNGTDDDGNGFIDDVHGWDFANDDATVFDANQPDDHGTHVAGTIAATIDNATDVTGVSGATILPLKFLGPQGGSTAHAIEALDYAIDQEVDVINASWGGGSFSGQLRNKIAQANTAGILFVAAAGNGGPDGIGDDNDALPHYPASYDNENIISVAATTSTDGLASFSNFGDVSVDLGAPGDDVLSTVPRFAKAVLVGPDTSAAVGYRSAYHSFGLEGVSSAAHRQAILSSALGWMGVGTDAGILLVDDDRGDGFQASYRQSLQSLGYPLPTTHTVPTAPAGCNNGPSAATMAGYDAVIWFTGDDFQCTLTSPDQTALQTYLGAGSGRNLLLFGQDIGYDLTGDGTGSSAFLENTLRVDYVADFDLNFRPSGVSGTPYEDVPTIQLNPSDPLDAAGGQLYSSALEPRLGAIAGMRGAPTAWYGGTSMATPHVSGTAALVMATYPSLGHLDVKARLLDRGDPISALDGKTVAGRRLNAYSSLRPLPAVGLSATASAGGAIDLAWTASPDAAGYQVYRGTAPGFPPSPANRINGALVTETTYTDTETVDGTTYHYVVRAQSSADIESLDSNEASATSDATSPAVTATSPADAETNVPLTATVSATFDEDVDPSTLGPSTLTLTGPGGAVGGDVSYDTTEKTATFTPDANLAYDSEYTAELSTGVEDLAGNPLAAPVTWTFHTTAFDTIAPEVQIDEPEPEAQVAAPSHSITGSAGDDVELSTVEVAVRRDSSGEYWDAQSATFVPVETWNEVDLEPPSGDAAAWSLGWVPPQADGEPFTAMARAKDTSDNVTEPPATVPFTVDNEPPSGAVSIDDGAPHTADTAVTLSLSASDGGGVAEVRVANGADPTGSYQPFAETLPWTLQAGADGVRTVHVQFRDEAGNESTVETDDIQLDATAPGVGLEALQRFQRGKDVEISWSGEDAGSGVDAFRVEVRDAKLKGAWSAWNEWTTTDELSGTFRAKPGRTYCFRVTATDLAGNTSNPAAGCTAIPANDRSLTKRGSWRNRQASGSYLGTFTQSKQRGARLVVGQVKARHLTLLHTRCKGCGKIQVRFKGEIIKRLNLAAPKLKRGAVRKIASFDKVQRGKMIIEVRTKGLRVPIEGVGVSRT